MDEPAAKTGDRSLLHMKRTSRAPAVNEVTIFDKLIQSADHAFSPKAARYIIALGFSPEQETRMRELLAKAQQGILTVAEDAEMQSYERVGHLLGIWKSKARKLLKRARSRSR